MAFYGRFPVTAPMRALPKEPYATTTEASVANTPDAVTRTLTIDSRDRVNFSTTTPSDFLVRFQPLFRVRNARLTSLEITNARYLIDSTNKYVDFVSGAGATAEVATLTEGHYSATDLATELDTQMNAELGAPPGAIFVVTYITQTGRFTINRVDADVFGLTTATGPNKLASPAKEFGFAMVDTATTLTTYTSANQANPQGDDYAMLCIDGFGCVTSSGSHSDVFAKVIWNTPARYATFNSFAGGIKEWRQPQDRIDHMHVRLLRPGGQICNLNGVDYSFTVEFQASPAT